jgi:hypothetical protein
MSPGHEPDLRAQPPTDGGDAPRGGAHWLDEPRNVRRLWRGFLAVLVATVLAEFAVALHPAFAIESVFGFNAAYGFLACAAMIVGAKLLGRLLKRPDTYYESDDER